MAIETVPPLIRVMVWLRSIFSVTYLVISSNLGCLLRLHPGPTRGQSCRCPADPYSVPQTGDRSFLILPAGAVSACLPLRAGHFHHRLLPRRLIQALH